MGLVWTPTTERFRDGHYVYSWGVLHRDIMVINYCWVALIKSVFDLSLTSFIDKNPHLCVTQNGILILWKQCLNAICSEEE